MPISRNHHGQLRADLLHYLATGKLVTAEQGLTLETFKLKHRWLDRSRTPTVIDEMRTLWSLHRDEIEQVAGGAAPWILGALRSPDDDEDESEEDTE
jgi:hypothetical protein